MKKAAEAVFWQDFPSDISIVVLCINGVCGNTGIIDRYLPQELHKKVETPVKDFYTEEVIAKLQ